MTVEPPSILLAWHPHSRAWFATAIVTPDGCPPRLVDPGSSEGETPAEALQQLLTRHFGILHADQCPATVCAVLPWPATEQARVTVSSADHPLVYPREITPALAEVLGMPNFQLHPVWMALREVGVTIAPRYEAEAAAALHFLIPFALDHGADWRIAAGLKLREMKIAQAASGSSAA